MYVRGLGKFETIAIRVYIATGSARPRFDYEGLRARVIEFSAGELVGPIVQGDRKLILLAEDVDREGVPLPLQTGPNWKAFVRGKELQIKAVDDNTRRLGGELIAFEIQVGG